MKDYIKMLLKISKNLFELIFIKIEYFFSKKI